MLSNSASKALFYGNGISTEFPYTFKVWETTQLLVEISDPEGITTEATGWTVELSENGGTVTYLHNGAPLPEGYSLVILRNMPFEQEVNLISGTRFDPEVIETALDIATAERQQLREIVSRGIKVPPTSEEPPELLAELIFEARDNALQSAVNAATSAAEAEESNVAAAALFTQIETATEDAITDITQNASMAVAEIAQSAENTKNAAVQEINTVKNDVLSATDGAITDIQQEGALQVAAISGTAEEAKAAAALARAWAESDTAPDPTNPDSRSAKAWAEWLAAQEGETLPDATTTIKGKVQLATRDDVLAGIGRNAVVADDLHAKITPLTEQISTIEITANTAQSTADTAKNNADTATNKANTATDKAEAAQDAADAAQSTADTAIANLAALQGTVSLTAAPNAIPIANAEGKLDTSWGAGGGGGGGVFAGFIAMYNGTFGGSDGKRVINADTGEADESWVVCDGTNGTPNLVNRFIKGASHVVSTQNKTGGSTSTSSATLSTAQMPSHTHGLYEGTGGSSSRMGVPVGNWTSQNLNSTTEATGSGQAHAHAGNEPPYYTLAYIMKLATN